MVAANPGRAQPPPGFFFSGFAAYRAGVSGAWPALQCLSAWLFSIDVRTIVKEQSMPLSDVPLLSTEVDAFAQANRCAEEATLHYEQVEGR